jgi:phenylacetate-CoA ligase
MFTTRLALRAIDLGTALVYRNYALYHWAIAHLPAHIEELGLQMAWRACVRAQEQVPAYNAFLAGRSVRPDRRRSLAEQFAAIPETDKNSYVRAFSAAERCVGGSIPARHVVVDESSGSTGVPYNWVRSRAEVRRTQRVCSYFHRCYLVDEPLFVINAFSMGAWATGATVGAALEDNGIVKSTGPDLEKILSTLRFFGPHYRYLITGYPPFLKHLLDYGDAQGFDWSAYRLVGMVGGEGMSENMRRYLLSRFEKVLSGYGASDLEVGVAAESDVSIALRQLMEQRADVREVLIGSERRVPMLFQYNPLDHYIEVNAHNELVVTITRNLLSPRIRYNVKDEGGVLSYAEVVARLRQVGVELPTLLPTGRWSALLPFVYVFGRSDSTISYMGANIYPEDVESCLFASAYGSRLGAFCMELLENEENSAICPCIHIEVIEGAPTEAMVQALGEILRERLSLVNADFRQALSEDQRAGELKVMLHAAGEGPFAQNNGRIKRRYIIESSQQEPAVTTMLPVPPSIIGA